MADMTQKEISDKYDVSQPYVSMVIKEAGIEACGSRQGEKRILKVYDEKTVTEAILEKYQAAAKRAKSAYDVAEGIYRKMEIKMRANGLFDNARWRL